MRDVAEHLVEDAYQFGQSLRTAENLWLENLFQRRRDLSC
jgi:hypothetical protein